MRQHRRSPAWRSSASAVTRFASSIVSRFRGATCVNWTLEAYDPLTDVYLLTCGAQQHQVIPAEQFNAWIEQPDGTWRAP